MVSILLNIGASIIAPLFFIAWIYFTKTKARFYWYAMTGLCISYLLLISLAGAAWSWFGIFWPYIFAVFFLLALLLSLKRKKFESWLPNKKREWINSAVTVAAFLLFSSSLTSLLHIRDYPREIAIQLEFPLINGRFQIVNGGGSEVVNRHYVVPAQKYALDIVKLNNYGFRANGLAPKDLNSYTIFGNQVVSPCDGIILETRDDLEDLIPLNSDKKIQRAISL